MKIKNIFSYISTKINTKVSFYRICYLLTILFLTAIVLIISLKSPGITGSNKANYVDMVYGKAYKPFVYRALTPTLIRLVRLVVPNEIAISINNHLLKNSIFGLIFSEQLSPKNDKGWEHNFLLEYLIGILIMYLFLIGFIYAFKLLMRSIYITNDKCYDLISIFAILGLPAFFKNYTHIYDPSTLFLFTLGLVLLVKAKWIPFIIIYLLGCINKETTILLTMIYFIYYYKILDKVRFKNILLTQIYIFVIIKTGLFIFFKKNLGSMKILTERNIKFIMKPNTLASISVFLVFFILIFYKWENKPKFLKDSILIIFPMFFLAIFWGLFYESRAFYEMYPILLLLISYSIISFIGAKISNVEYDYKLLKSSQSIKSEIV